MIKECQACGQTHLLAATTASNGGYGPNLLPGTGSWRPARFEVVVCGKCGYVHWFVQKEDLDKVKRSKHFQPYRPS